MKIDLNGADGKALVPLRTVWLFGLFILVLTMIAYQPVWHAGFIWNDDEFLTDNPLIKSLDFRGAGALGRIWFATSLQDYYPMNASLLWLEWQFWGNNPLGYHLVNVLLHVCSAILLWRVLQKLKIPGAALAAAIFALHPVNVESVAWISEDKNTLSMLFYLGTLLFWLNWTDTGERRFYGMALGGFALALFSKTAAAPLPVVLLLIHWWRHGKLGWKDFRQVLPFFLMAAVMCSVTVWFHDHRAIGHDIIRTDGFGSRLAVAGGAVWFYLYKAVLPLNLAFVYPRWRIGSPVFLDFIPLFLLAAAFGACWRFWRGWGKDLFFGLAYFVVMLLPILGFLNVYFMRYSLVADHWEYFAMIAPIALAGASIRRPVWAALLLLTLGALTWEQCKMYANSETLWQTTLRRNPQCWLAWADLGADSARRGQMDEAIAQFQKSLAIKSDNMEARRNLGLALSRQGRTDEAVSEYEKALAIDPQDVQTRLNLGNSFLQTGRMNEAMAQYQKVLEIEPDNAEAHNNLGNNFVHMGRMDEAMLQYQKALEISPDFPEAHNGLGACLYRQGKIDDAIAHYESAVRTKPAYADAHQNLGIAFFRQGRQDDALSQYQTALDIKTNDPALENNIAWILATSSQASLRDGRRALNLAQKANESTGSQNPFFLHTLAAAYAETGQFDEAARTVRQAIALAQAAGQQDAVAHLNEELKRYEGRLPLH
jgi:tetratricopeptide (TPR) repeat protein